MILPVRKSFEWLSDAESLESYVQRFVQHSYPSKWIQRTAELDRVHVVCERNKRVQMSEERVMLQVLMPRDVRRNMK